MSELRTDFKDEILQEGETHRVYDIKRKGTDEIVESDIYLEKAYTPLQEGNEFGAKEVNEIHGRLNGLAPQSLTINSDFQINQRGKAEYNESKDGSYTLDMWKTRQGNYSNAIKIVPKKGGGITVTLPSAGISAGINQFLPYEDTDLGKKFTAVVSIDKVPYPFTFELSTSANKTNIKKGVEFSCSYNNDLKCIEYRLYFTNNSEHNIQNIPFDVDYCDLFPGEIAYEHQKEDYATALMRCREKIRKCNLIGYLRFDYGTEGVFVCVFEKAFDKTPVILNITVTYYPKGGTTQSKTIEIPSATLILNDLFQFKMNKSDFPTGVNCILVRCIASIEPL